MKVLFHLMNKRSKIIWVTEEIVEECEQDYFLFFFSIIGLLYFYNRYRYDNVYEGKFLFIKYSLFVINSVILYHILFVYIWYTYIYIYLLYKILNALYFNFYAILL